MIVSDRITDENMDQIELEIATKIVLFERKLSKLRSIKLSEQVSTSIKLQVKHLRSGTGHLSYQKFNNPDCNFELEVQSSLTVGELTRVIGEVWLTRKTKILCYFQKRNSIKYSGSDDFALISIYSERGTVFVDRNKTIAELGFQNGTVIKHFWN